MGVQLKAIIYTTLSPGTVFYILVPRMGSQFILSEPESRVLTISKDHHGPGRGSYTTFFPRDEKVSSRYDTPSDLLEKRIIAIV